MKLEKAQKMLSEYFLHTDKLMDEAFFRKYLHKYEPIFREELPKMTHEIIKCM